MIRANRQLIADRKLFSNLQKHSHTLDIDCQPDKFQQLNQQTKNLILNIKKAVLQKLSQINSKIQKLDYNLNRLFAAIKYKKSNSGKLFSFSNSPNQKSYQMSNTPQSAKKYVHQTSTEPKTDYKFMYQSAHQKNYLNSQIVFLHRQIQQLRSQLERTHNFQNIHIINVQEGIQMQRRRQKIPSNLDAYKNLPHYWKEQLLTPKNKQLYRHIDSINQNLQQTPNKQQQNQKIQRYEIIIKQYEKQQQILRVLAGKSNKYKQCLKQVLKWLKYLKQIQLPKYLPCQACEIKKFLNKFLQNSTNNSISKNNLNKQQQYNKNNSNYSIRSQKNSENQFQYSEFIINKDDYKISENSSQLVGSKNRNRAKSYTYANEANHDEDQLLVQLERITNSQNSNNL